MVYPQRITRLVQSNFFSNNVTDFFFLYYRLASISTANQLNISKDDLIQKGY